MSTPEGAVKRKVSALLKAHGVYYEMPVPSGFGKSGLDYTGCHEGLFFAIETKAPGKAPTPRQLLTIDSMQKAGGKVFVVSDEESLGHLEYWLMGLMQ